MTKRLTPMIDDPSEPESVRELLAAGRDFQVTDYDFDKGLTKHLAQIKAGAPAPQWAESLTSAGAASSSTLVTWIALPIVTASVIATVLLSTSSEPGARRPTADVPRPAPAPATLAAEPVAPTAASAPGTEASEFPSAPALLAPEAAPPAAQPSPPAPPEPPARVAPHARKSSAARASTRTPAVASAKAEGMLPAHAAGQPLGPREAKSRSGSRAAGEAQASGAESRATAKRSAAAASAATTASEDPRPVADAERVEPPVRPEPAPQDDARLEREMAMLSMSQRVLDVDPERALKLARQGEAEFPGSMFTQERQQLLLLALVKLGRLDDAKRLAKPYLARYPKGPFSDRVRRALTTGRVEH
jgi:hypothetical protein